MANLSNINGKFVVEQTTGYVGVGTTDPNFLIEAAGANSEIALNSTSASIYRLRSTSSDSFIITKNGVGDRLVINSAGNATFAGTVETTTLRTDVINNKANSANIIYRSGTSTLVGGGTTANKLYVLDNGRVGIGTTSPAYKLQVQDANAAIVYVKSTTNNQNASIWFNSNSGGTQADRWEIGTNISAGTDLEFFDRLNSVSRMVIQNDGKVGIGTISPQQKLHVNGNVRVGTDTGFIDFARPGGAIVGGIGWHTDDYFYVAGHPTAGTGAGNSVRVYAFGALLSLGNPTAGDALTVAVNGNVGIGTTLPEQRLHVEGRGIFDGGASSDILQIRNDNGGGVFGMTSNLFSLDLASTSNFRIRQGSTTPLYITSAGRVGIGKTNPQAALDISSSYSIQGNVRTYMYAGTATGQTNINLDITVGNEGGQGNVFKIEAGFAHYYAMNYNSIAEWWCTSRGTTVINTYILNASSTLGGAWSASKPSTTVLRITKSAGTYSGSGKYWVKVTYVPF